MKLKPLLEAFRHGELPKAAFIQAAGEIHQQLFEYPSILAACDVREIRIDRTGVLFQVGAEGLWLRCPSGEARVVPLETMNFGAYEPAETAVMLSALQGAQTVFDVGANIGWFSMLFAKHAPAASVHAFEPLGVFFEHLTENVRLNALGERVHTHQLGFSNERANVDYFIDAGNGTNASLRNVAASPTALAVSGMVVPMDAWVAEHGAAPDFIKCDVEGAELLVLQGARAVLAAHAPVVFVELLRKWSKPYGYHPNDVLALLAEHGYGCFAVGESGVRAIDTVTDETLETNYVFLHREHHASRIAALQVAR